MHDVFSTVFVITTSIGIFLYIYNARRKHSQMMAQYNQKLIKAKLFEHDKARFPSYPFKPLNREVFSALTEVDEPFDNSAFNGSSITLWKPEVSEINENRPVVRLLKPYSKPCYRRELR